MSTIDKVGKFFSFPTYLEQIGRINWENLIFKLILRFLRKIIIFPNSVNILLRRFEVSTFNSPNRDINNIGPEIDVLILVADKDLFLVNQVIRGAIYSSLNPVKNIFLVTPEPKLLKDYISKEFYNSVKIYKDEDIIDANLSSNLDVICGARAGWIKQQLIVNQFIFKFALNPILNIDCDCILTCKRLWINFDGVQILTPTWEYHKGYYKFLFNINKNLYKKIDISNVPHHMLFIPDILRQINLENNFDRITSIDLIASYIKYFGVDSIDFKYEYYAQAYLSKKYPVRFEKWSNLSLKRSLFNEIPNSDGDRNKFEKWANEQKYASISFHAWNL